MRGYCTNGFLVCTSPIHGVVQKFFSTSLQPCFPYHLHFPTLPGHSSGRDIYSSMRREDNWPHMAKDVSTIVRDCRDCTRNKPSEKWQNALDVCLASVPLEFVATYILRKLPKMLRVNQFVLVMTDC